MTSTIDCERRRHSRDAVGQPCRQARWEVCVSTLFERTPPTLEKAPGILLNQAALRIWTGNSTIRAPSARRHLTPPTSSSRTLQASVGAHVLGMHIVVPIVRVAVVLARLHGRKPPMRKRAAHALASTGQWPWLARKPLHDNQAMLRPNTSRAIVDERVIRRKRAHRYLKHAHTHTHQDVHRSIYTSLNVSFRAGAERRRGGCAAESGAHLPLREAAAECVGWRLPQARGARAQGVDVSSVVYRATCRVTHTHAR